MAIADFSLFQTRRTVDEAYSAYRALIRAVCPEYTTKELSDIGNAIAYVMCGLGDALHTRYDIEANQLLIDKVVRKATFKSLAQIAGFDLEPAAAATVDVALVVSGLPPTEDVPIPMYWGAMSSSTGQPFVNLNNGLVLPANRRTFVVPMTHGRGFQDALGVTDDGLSQSFITQTTGILHNSSQRPSVLTVGGVKWDIVDSFAQSLSTSFHAVMRRLADGRMEVTFGDGVYGKIPEAGREVVLSGVIGGGEAGNVGPGAIDEPSNTLYSLSGNPVTVSVTNVAAASGGKEEQTVLVARKLLPGRVRSNDRCVTLADYEAQAMAVPGVGTARAERTGLCIVSVTVVASGSTTGIPSNALLDQVLARLNERKMATDIVKVRAPSFVYVDITATLTNDRRVAIETAKANVRTTCDKLFSVSGRLAAAAEVLGPSDLAVSSGGNIYYSDVDRAIDETEGVSHLTLSRLTRRPTPVFDQWTGTAAFTAGPTPGASSVDTFRVTFTSPTTFIVTGEVAGFVGGGQLGTPFTASGGQVAFTLVAGTTAMVAYDFCSFKTTKPAGDIELATNEVAILGDLVLLP